ncbi:MAG: acyl carrier protein [Selenomonas sp.]
MDAKETILTMLGNIKPEYDFTTSEDYLTDGYLDSMDVVMLNGMLEETFHIKIDGMDILPENYANADTILALVQKSERTAEHA